jgi:hypothetical protein
MNYYIYENWKRESELRPIIHKWNCGFCHMGFGMHQNADRGRNGVWLGPFDELEFARTYYENKFGNPLNECNCVNN